ncbi:MAG: ribosome recycling factor [Pseudomonadota bacterium]
MIDEILADARARMGKSIEAFRASLAKLRTGRAHPSLLEHVFVDYYGARTPLTQAANVSVEDGRTLSVAPWDKSMIEPIERAILESDLGLNPNTAGAIIRIPIPPLTEERRKDLIKVLKAEAEQARVAVRNIRRDAIADFKDLAKEKEISEDDARRAEDSAQKVTDEFVARIEQVMGEKEQELLEI